MTSIRTKHVVSLLLPLLFITACGEPIEEPLEEALSLHLLQVQFEEVNGNLRHVDHQQITIDRNFAPSRPTGGDYLAVAFDGETAIDATWFSLPHFTFEHGDDGENDHELLIEDIDTPAASIAFVADQPMTEIRVFDSSDAILLSFDPNVFTVAHADTEKPAHVRDFEDAHPGVRFLMPDFGRVGTRVNGRTAIAADEEQVRKLTTAFDALPATLKGSISELVVTRWNSTVNAGAQTFGFRVMFNEGLLDSNDQDEVNARMHHEAVHSLTNLLDGRSSGTSALASSFVTQARSELPVIGEFHETWCEIQNVAISAGISRPYNDHRGDKTALCQTNGVRLPSNAEARKFGFSGRYGQSVPREDMADFAAKAEWGAARGGLPTQCAPLANGDIAAEPLAYAKLRLLAAYGMITQERLEECLGASLNAPDEEGIVLGTDTYADDLIAGQALVDSSARATIIADAKDGTVCNLSTPGRARGGAFRIDAEDAEVVSNRAALRLDGSTENTAYNAGLVFVDESDVRIFQGRIVLAGVKSSENSYRKDSIIVVGSFKSTDFLLD